MPQFILRSRDVESHPEKDGSSSHVAKHSPEDADADPSYSAARFRHFSRTGCSARRQFHIDTMCAEKEFWPRPKRLGKHLGSAKRLTPCETLGACIRPTACCSGGLPKFMRRRIFDHLLREVIQMISPRIWMCMMQSDPASLRSPKFRETYT